VDRLDRPKRDLNGPRAESADDQRRRTAVGKHLTRDRAKDKAGQCSLAMGADNDHREVSLCRILSNGYPRLLADKMHFLELDSRALERTSGGFKCLGALVFVVPMERLTVYVSRDPAGK
jgi:hypothetical protein